MNPFRWSTKFTDDQTDLVYYGYRYYSAGLGRWINRDPMGEDGGINLYAFLANDGIRFVDPNGLTALSDIQRIRKLVSFYKQVKDVVTILKKFDTPITRLNPLSRVIGGGAYAMLYSATAVLQGAVDILQDKTMTRRVGTLEANAINFVRDIVAGDQTAVDLDAATIAVQVASPPGDWRDILSRGYATSDAVTAWSFLETLADLADN